MLRTFLKFQQVILVGIAGGIPRGKSRPDPNDNIHVGDVVVGWPGDGGPSHVN
jgi:nucleoside phosphorylase